MARARIELATPRFFRHAVEALELGEKSSKEAGSGQSS